jgi:hypothetical protein
MMGVKVKSEGQKWVVIILIKTLFFEDFLLDQVQTWCQNNTWSAIQLISFEGRSPMTFMVNARVKNGVPKVKFSNRRNYIV